MGAIRLLQLCESTTELTVSSISDFQHAQSIIIRVVLRDMQMLNDQLE
jgi:hypothetical protein